MATKKPKSEIELKGEIQLELTRRQLIRTGPDAWRPEDDEYEGPWDGDVSEYDSLMNAESPFDDDFLDDADDGEVEYIDGESSASEQQSAPLTDSRRERFRRAEAQASVIAHPAKKVLAYREIASYWRPWDVTKAKALLDKCRELVEHIEDPDGREVQLQDLVKCYVYDAFDQQAALALAKTLPPSVAKVKALLSSWKFTDEGKRLHVERQLLEMAIAETRQAKDALFIFDAAIAIARELTPDYERGQTRRFSNDITEWMERAEGAIPSIKPKSKRDTRIRKLAEWYVHCGLLERGKELMAEVGNRDHRIKFFIDTAETLLVDGNPEDARIYLNEAAEANEGYNTSAKTPRERQQQNYGRLAELYIEAGDLPSAISRIDSIEEAWSRGFLLGRVVGKAATVDPAEVGDDSSTALDKLHAVLDSIADPEIDKASRKRLDADEIVKKAALESLFFIFEDADSTAV